MKAAVITFPGSNCDRDLAVAFAAAGAAVTRVWHKDTDLPPGTDIVGLPGGFSFGDYLRCGAIAAQSPVMRAVAAHIERGGYAIGICNGFQVLTEAGMLPGVLMRNASLRFICRTVALRVETAGSVFTRGWNAGDVARLPVAHHDGNYVIDDAGLAALRDQDLIAFRYCNNPNGATDAIAGVLSANRRVLGMMPHPERAADPELGPADGQRLFGALAAGLVAA
jgi:phosphoribosylformylglycinamidine synthase